MATEPESIGTQAAEAGCPHFERTLALLDGVAEGREAAQAHAAGCAVCGPLVAGWSAAAAALVGEYEDRAERAKPDLAKMADRVLARIDERREAPQKARPARWLSLLQPWVALAAAAAAFALVLAPLVTSEGPGGVPVADHGGAPAGDAVAAGDARANDCLIRKVTFEGADGMVFRTERGGMTVIWINEHPGA